MVNHQKKDLNNTIKIHLKKINYKTHGSDINSFNNLHNQFIFEKSDYERMKEAEKLPSFTKEEAERYYYTELRSK